MQEEMALGKIKRLEWEELTETNGRLVVEPFRKGLAITVGNSLRRMLLSSIKGAAVTSINVDGILHEFTSIPGVVEDIIDIILNIKGIVFRFSDEAPKMVFLEKKEKGEVKAKDLVVPSGLTIVNPEHHIMTVSEITDSGLRMEMEVEVEIGYVPADETKREKKIGTLPIDTYFSPVVRVSCEIEDVRVGRVTDYEKLILKVKTNGSITPKDALSQAASILSDYISIFIKPEGFVEKEIEVKPDDEQEKLKHLLNTRIDELEISVRASNCLHLTGITKIGELILLPEANLLKMRNFGRKSLTEIKEKLATYNLRLGMTDFAHLMEKGEELEEIDEEMTNMAEEELWEETDEAPIEETDEAPIEEKDEEMTNMAEEELKEEKDEAQKEVTNMVEEELKEEITNIVEEELEEEKDEAQKEETEA
ncbi:DNA-directed RNA polymerase subunit alpha [bacterium]|nr:DNA-directed RNA polymerase subunit alpha [bacterium]